MLRSLFCFTLCNVWYGCSARASPGRSCSSSLPESTQSAGSFSASWRPARSSRGPLTKARTLLRWKWCLTRTSWQMTVPSTDQSRSRTANCRPIRCWRKKPKCVGLAYSLLYEVSPFIVLQTVNEECTMHKMFCSFLLSFAFQRSFKVFLC